MKQQSNDSARLAWALAEIKRLKTHNDALRAALENIAVNLEGHLQYAPSVSRDEEYYMRNAIGIARAILKEVNRATQ